MGPIVDGLLNRIVPLVLCLVVGEGCTRLGFEGAGRATDGGAQLDRAISDHRPGDASPAEARPSPDGARDDAQAPDMPAPPDTRPPDDLPAPPVTCGAGAIICEDFEAAGLLGWKPYGEAGGATRDTATSFGGVASLRARRITSEGRAAVTRSLPSATTSGQLYARVRFYPHATTTRYAFVTVAESGPPYQGISLGVRDGKLQGYTSVSEQGGVTANDVVFDAWNCAEIRVLISDTAGVLEFSLNGGVKVQRTGIDTLPAAGYQSTNVGIPDSAAVAGEIIVVLDDYELSTTSLPCN